MLHVVINFTEVLKCNVNYKNLSGAGNSVHISILLYCREVTITHIG
jgi:hypothetical protein